MARGFIITLAAIFTLLTASGAWATRTVPEAPKTMVGDLKYGKTIPVLITTLGEEKNAKLHWAVFEQEDNLIKADVRATIISWPKNKWWIHVSIMDKEGNQLAYSTGVVENSGIIVGRPAISEGDLRFTIGPLPDIQKATLFSVSIAQAADFMEPDMELFHETFDWPWEKEGDKSLELSVIGPDGKEIQAEATLWRKVDSPVPDEPLSALHDRPVRWESDGATWVAVRSIGGLPSESPYKIKDLPPAVYRVSVTSRGADPTPAEASPILDLTRQKDVKTVVQLKNGYPLTVNVLNAANGKPIPETQVLLRRADGMPFWQGGSTANRAAADGSFRFASLEPGVYRLEVGRRDWWSVLHPETIKSVNVIVRSVTDNKITVLYDKPELWPEE